MNPLQKDQIFDAETFCCDKGQFCNKQGRPPQSVTFSATVLMDSVCSVESDLFVVSCIQAVQPHERDAWGAKAVPEHGQK